MRKHLILIPILALTQLLFNGCCKRQLITKKVYIKQKCPKLNVFDINTSDLMPLDINYTIKEINEDS